jgi:sialate O-acetylesterase
MNILTSRPFFTLFILSTVSVFAGIVSAEVKLPNVIGSDMVLQRDLPVPIWGWADSGEEVTVSFAGQSKTTKAGDDGKWMIKLDKLEANAKASSLTVAGSNEITLDNILVGEVWICSGQSNMEWRLSGTTNAKEEVAASDHPLIRLFDVPGHTTSPKPQEEGRGNWQVCNPKTSGGFSAVGYFFGRRLNKELEVPVGLIGSNWGGTRIEPWTTLAGFESVPELADIAKKVKDYKADTKVGGGSPSAIYNSMVHPLAPFAMRGGIWYQGESNGGEHMSYYHKKHALVNGWRKVFQNKDLGFYWVQLANFQFRTPAWQWPSISRMLTIQEIFIRATSRTSEDAWLSGRCTKPMARRTWFRPGRFTKVTRSKVAKSTSLSTTSARA